MENIWLELCDYIHDAILNNCAVEVKFSWVRCKMLYTTGPGYYGAVNVTRRGEWQPIVCKKVCKYNVTLNLTQLT